ncbi:MAG TPA: zinc-ribbon domain-containing protein, partial [Chroococcales cyanobacterium]
MSKQPRIAIEDLIRPFPIKKRPSLAESHPAVAVYWNYQKNKGWGPEDFSHGSNVKVWWHCPQYREHLFQQVIQVRVKAETDGSKFHGCIYCRGRLPSSTNWLANYPDLAKEWLAERNGCSVRDVVAG